MVTNTNNQISELQEFFFFQGLKQFPAPDV